MFYHEVEAERCGEFTLQEAVALLLIFSPVFNWEISKRKEKVGASRVNPIDQLGTLFFSFPFSVISKGREKAAHRGIALSV